MDHQSNIVNIRYIYTSILTTLLHGYFVMTESRTLLITVFLIITSAIATAQSSIADILNEQVEAFNNQDIDHMVRNLHEDFAWYYIGSDDLVLELSGKKDFRSSMESYFQSIVDVHSTISGSVIDGNRISFQEIVEYKTAAGKEGRASSMGIYEVRDNLIYRVWYFY